MIDLLYGSCQRFRYRYRDITLRGSVRCPLPVRSARYRLNASSPVDFYVEALPHPPALDWRFAYKASPARLRLPQPGEFTIEIPVDSPALHAGINRVAIEIVDAGDGVHDAEFEVHWDPRPVELPLELADLTRFAELQDVGQVINGAFDLDRDANAIRARTPVAPDALLILAAPAGSQEATYRVVFADLERGKYLGLSDFFVCHEEEAPPIGIKPGWSTAGLATLTYGWRPGSPAEVGRDPGRPLAGEARAWLARSDNSRQAQRWLVKTDPPATLALEPGVAYRVRHRVEFADGVNRVRFRIWPEAAAEPHAWLCDISDAGVSRALPRFTQASFALFQHTGAGTAWSNIRLRAL
jgi:hypothetical protein